MSNSTGNNWGLSGLAYGSYTLSASLNGYVSPNSQTVTVNSASNSVIFAFVTEPTDFTVAGSYQFTVPSGVTSLSVTLIGGGGGGGGGDMGYGLLGGSGGGGASGNVDTQTVAVIPGQTFNVDVGAGGSGGQGVSVGGGFVPTAGSGSPGQPSDFYSTSGPSINIGLSGGDYGMGGQFDISTSNYDGGDGGVVGQNPGGPGIEGPLAGPGGPGGSGYGSANYGQGGAGGDNGYNINGVSGSSGAVLISYALPRSLPPDVNGICRLGALSPSYFYFFVEFVDLHIGLVPASVYYFSVHYANT